MSFGRWQSYAAVVLGLMAVIMADLTNLILLPSAFLVGALILASDSKESKP